MHNKIHVLICINKTNNRAVYIVSCHFDQKINICISKMPGRTVTKSYIVLKLPLAGEIVMIFLRSIGNKVKYEFPLKFGKEGHLGSSVG